MKRFINRTQERKGDTQQIKIGIHGHVKFMDTCRVKKVTLRFRFKYLSFCQSKLWIKSEKESYHLR
jgi:hypothetical protein